METSVAVIGYDQKYAGKRKPGAHERKASGTAAVVGCSVVFISHATGQKIPIKTFISEGEAERFARQWLGVGGEA